MDQPSAIPRPSGLPRPTSRLPVLKPSSSQSQLRAPASTEQLRKKPSVSSLSRPAQQQQPLQKKSSRASLVRSNTPSTTPSLPSAANRASVSTTASRRVSGIPSFAASRASISTTDPVFKRPFARPPSRQTNAAPKAAAGSNKEDDGLGSLDGFRSASRASSRAGSRAGFHDDDVDQDYTLVNSPELGNEEVTKKKSRPSLSERTIESLSQLPPSPAGGKGRRRSSFFNADNNMPPPLRPASAMSSNGGSRPGTSDGSFNGTPATPKRFGSSTSRLSMTAPGKRSISASVNTPVATPSRLSTTSRPVSTIKKQPSLQLQTPQTATKPRPLSVSKSMVARTPRSRPSLTGMFDKPTSPSTASTIPTTPSRNLGPPAKKTPDTTRRVSSSSLALREHIAKAKASRKSEVTEDTMVEVTAPSPKAGSSSNALRAQIAKAKEAARKAAKAEPERTSTPPRDAIVPDPQEIASFDFGLDDPFNQGSKGSKSLLRKRIDGARVEGRLNIAAMGLKEIPDEVLQMYQYDANDATVAWGEVVDLSTIVAADNELETLPDAMFPDIAIEDAIDMDEGGPQFGGVQSVDIHGNALQGLPRGFGRLTQLTKLNLSRNKLSIEVFDIVSNIASLRELKLAENDLKGDLPASLGSLTAMEVLELQDNKLTSLPAEVRHMVALRSLNISNNQIHRLPSELFSTGLIALNATNNKFEGSFLENSSIPHLQELNIANNTITSLHDDDTIDAPALKHLNISTNRFTSLPNMETWVNLNTLLVAENKLTSLPDSLYELPVQTIDLTANDIVQLDPRLGKMTLKHLTVAANPLRERKFLTMAVEDIQRDLSSRLQVDEPEDAVEAEQQNAEEDATSAAGWQVTPSGTLDLSSKDLKDNLDETNLTSVADSVRQLYLQQNAFSSIPLTFTLLTNLTTLDLSRNAIETVLTSPLSLPKLRDLRLSANKLTSLDPLTTHLSAPALQTLDVSANRLTSTLPTLRDSFPSLISLIASDNRMSDVTADSIKGLKIVNVSNNDIERLDPEIGLLHGTLTSFLVEGNKFRVPNWQTLQRGTEAVLGWLRDRVPAERKVERESWRSEGSEGMEFFDAIDGGVD